MHTSLTFQTTLRQPLWRLWLRQDPKDISNPLSDPFFTKRMKLLSRPDGFMLYGKLGFDFFSISELLYPNMKIRLRIIRARPLTWLAATPTSVLELWIAHFTLVVLLLRMSITKREWTCSLMLLLNTIIRRLWQRHSSYLPDIHSRKHFQQYPHSVDCFCNEHKLYLYWFFYWKPILVSTI